MSSRFNEAAAVRPQMDCRGRRSCRFQLRCFNEAAAVRPQMAHNFSGSLGLTTRFNEAAAVRPQMVSTRRTAAHVSDWLQ